MKNNPTCHIGTSLGTDDIAYDGMEFVSLFFFFFVGRHYCKSDMPHVRDLGASLLRSHSYYKMGRSVATFAIQCTWLEIEFTEVISRAPIPSP